MFFQKNKRAAVSASVGAFVAVGGILGGVAGVNAAGSQGTYVHGQYSQAHYSSRAACDYGRTKAINTLANYGAVHIYAGYCHQIDAQSGSLHQTGYVYNVRYQRSRPLWFGDKTLGVNPASTANSHSFRASRSEATKVIALQQESILKNILSHRSGTKITWTSGVALDAKTKRWVFEVDYNAPTPLSGAAVEVSENPNVTTPSLNIKVIAPTNPTSQASSSGVKAVGQATMGWTNGTAVSPTTTATPVPVATNSSARVAGIDISGHTSINDWSGWKNAGVKFLYTKSTEGNYYQSPKFSAQYSGASANNIIRGAYHFAIPSISTGATQADYFISHGGGWTADGKTLPGAVDLEWNPYGSTCYGLSKTQMQSWINSFTTEYKAKTGVNPVIYSANYWWNQCVGTPSGSYATPGSPVLWMASYASTPGAIPAAWSGRMGIWQNSAVNSKGYDTNIYQGGLSQLQLFASRGWQ